MTYYFFKITRYTALFCLAVILLAQCKRPEEPSGGTDAGSPVFSVMGNFGGNNNIFSAGIDSVYMYTSYNYDTAEGLYEFTGKLEKINCSGCSRLEVSIADTLPNSGADPVDMDLAIQNKIYSYYYPAPVKVYTLTFTAQDSGYTAPSYFWDFGNGQTATTKTAVGVFYDTNTQKVCLTVKDLGGAGCQKSKCNYVKPVWISSGIDSCIADFDYFVADTGLLKTNFINASTASASYFWDFGDGNTSTLAAPQNLYGKKGSYNVCLTASKASCKRTLCKTVVVKDAAFDCASSFMYNNPAENTITLTPFSKVKITYVDKGGTLFESAQNLQPADSYFIIDTNKEYEPNEKGQKTKKLGIRFKCRVFDKSGTSFIDITNAQGTFGIAYP